jgi:hypothetical protein
LSCPAAAAAAPSSSSSSPRRPSQTQTNNHPVLCCAVLCPFPSPPALMSPPIEVDVASINPPIAHTTSHLVPCHLIPMPEVIPT